MIRHSESGDARSGGFGHVGVHLVAALVGACVGLAPAPGWTQESDGPPPESETETADSGASAGETSSKQEREPSKEGEPASEGQEGAERPTPELSLLPVGTASDDVSSIVPERISELLRDQLKGEAAVDLLPSFEETQRARADRSGASAVEKAREKYRSGNGLANAGDFERAAKPLSEAVKMLRKHLADLEQFSVYTDALLKLAWSYWKIDHNYDARKSMKEFAHLEPDAELDEEKFPAKLLEVYREEVKKIEEAGPGTVVIDAEPQGGTVWLDGEKRGEAPVRIEDVGFGYHYAVVEGPEGGRVSKQLRIRGGGEEQKFALEVGERAGAEPDEENEEPELPAFYTELTSSIDGGAFERSKLEPYLTELAKRTEAEYAAWVVLVKGEAEYTATPFVYRMSDQKLMRGDDVVFTLQLSNLRVGVRELAASVVERVRSKDEWEGVESVALGTEIEEESEAAPSEQKDEKTGGAETARADQQTGGSESGPAETGGDSVEPPPSPEPSESSGDGNRTWTYVGIGGAAAAVGGLVAGGVLLMNNQQQQPDGFSATVTW